MSVGPWAGFTYLRYTVLKSPKKDEPAVHCCDPALSVLDMFGVSKRLSPSISFAVYCLPCFLQSAKSGLLTKSKQISATWVFPRHTHRCLHASERLIKENPLICKVVYRAYHKCKYFSTTCSSTNQIVRTLPAQRHPMHTSWRHSAFITWLTTSKWAINKRLTTESVARIVVVKCVDKITAFNRKMIICCLHWVYFMMSAQSSGLLPPDEVKMSCKSVNIPVWVWLWNWPLLYSFCSVGRFTHICRSLGSVAWKIPNSLQQYCFGVCFRGICQVIVPFCHKIEKS